MTFLEIYMGHQFIEVAAGLYRSRYGSVYATRFIPLAVRSAVVTIP